MLRFYGNFKISPFFSRNLVVFSAIFKVKNREVKQN